MKKSRKRLALGWLFVVIVLSIGAFMIHYREELTVSFSYNSLTPTRQDLARVAELERQQAVVDNVTLALILAGAIALVLWIRPLPPEHPIKKEINRIRKDGIEL